MKSGKRLLCSLLVLPVLCFSPGCGKDKSDPAGSTPEAAVTTEPVTLKVYNWDMITDEMFQRLFVEPVQKKYPNITLEKITRGKDTAPESLVIGGNEVDMIFGWNDVMNTFENLELLADITPLVKKHQIDLGRFEPTNLEGIRMGHKDKLLGLPFAYDFYATFYNKDIFDKFGVPYPRDGMTWDDAIEVAKKLTRNEDGVQYKGLDPEGIEKLGNSLSLPFVDPQTNRAAADLEGWRKVFELAKRINDIPGNQFSITSHAGTVDRFIKQKIDAMLPTHAVLPSLENAEGLNWDIAQYPSFPERPNTYGMVKTAVMSLAATSKHPDEVMEVMKIVTSDETQLQLMKMATLLTGLDNKDLQQHFGEEKPFLKGKHVEAIFKSKPAPFVPQTLYSGKVRGIFEAKYKDYVAGKDLNTALREAEEEGNQLIDSMKK